MQTEEGLPPGLSAERQSHLENPEAATFHLASDGEPES